MNCYLSISNSYLCIWSIYNKSS